MGKTNPKRTQTNPIYRGVASGEAGTNPTCPGVASGEAGKTRPPDAQVISRYGEQIIRRKDEQVGEKRKENQVVKLRI